MSKAFHPHAFFLIGLLAINSFLLPSATVAATFYIYLSAISNGIGTLARPFISRNSVSFKFGNTYLQKAGTTYPGVLIHI